MIDPISFSTAFMLGLLSSTHCIGMCGGIAMAMALQPETARIIGPDQPNPAIRWQQWTSRLTIPLMFNSGRISCYVILGVLFGAIAYSLADLLQPVSDILRSISGFILVAMGLYIGQWWLGISRLEQAGSKVWQYVQPLTRHLMPIKTVQQAYCCGLLWGLLPCGMIYSILAWTVSSNQTPWAGLIMLAFGLGTLPAMLLNVVFFREFKRYMQHPLVRNSFALLLIVLGIVTIASNGLLDGLDIAFLNSHHHAHH